MELFYTNSIGVIYNKPKKIAGKTLKTKIHNFVIKYNKTKSTWAENKENKTEITYSLHTTPWTAALMTACRRRDSWRVVA